MSESHEREYLLSENLAFLSDHSAPERVLDKGSIRLVDIMGNDSSVVRAARVSYGEGTKTFRDDRGLIRYLMQHRHTKPFEMCVAVFHIKCPIFIARQFDTYRTGSKNEISGRYSILKNEFYIPENSRINPQSTSNKQGSEDTVLDDSTKIIDTIVEASGQSSFHYDYVVKKGLTRELSRSVLPLNTYTEFFWKMDLHNLLSFLQQRLDKNAQHEIRVYADKIAEVLKKWVPLVWEAFRDYRLEAVTFSRMEMEVLRQTIFHPEHSGMLLFKSEFGECCVATDKILEENGMNKREINEFMEKWK